MARLYLFAEGQTEQTFADSVLKPHLARFAVYLQNSQTVANSRRKGKVHRGGGMSYTPMRDDIHRRMKQEKSADVYFTTMIDLYALYSDFPGREEAEKLRHNPSERGSNGLKRHSPSTWGILASSLSSNCMNLRRISSRTRRASRSPTRTPIKRSPTFKRLLSPTPLLN